MKYDVARDAYVPGFRSLSRKAWVLETRRHFKHVSFPQTSSQYGQASHTAKGVLVEETQSDALSCGQAVGPFMRVAYSSLLDSLASPSLRPSDETDGLNGLSTALGYSEVVAWGSNESPAPMEARLIGRRPSPVVDLFGAAA
eukprot:GHVU01121559.1.p2 GENE.GHVU01121559.1~~GHVU01121559.1.p2  ORF type:complete len:142 (-),score=8.68 GHVU01121559.1:203-628(-)